MLIVLSLLSISPTICLFPLTKEKGLADYHGWEPLEKQRSLPHCDQGAGRERKRLESNRQPLQGHTPVTSLPSIKLHLL